MPDLLEAALLALLQGLTEFLPISSHGHLVLGEALLGIEDPNLTAFNVVVHLGSLVAVLAWFRRDLAPIHRAFLASLRGPVEGETAVRARLARGVLLATIPICVAVLLIGDDALEALEDPVVVAWASIGFSALLVACDLLGRKRRSVEALEWRDVWAAGLFQVLALIPGASRSGMTISGGLATGLTREAAARFSFLLAIPTILLAGGHEGLALFREGLDAPWSRLLVGFVVSAVSAYLCIDVFVRFVERIGMLPFAVYRVLLGIGILAWAA